MVQQDEDLRLSIKNICGLLFVVIMKLHALISLFSIVLCTITCPGTFQSKKNNHGRRKISDLTSVYNSLNWLKITSYLYSQETKKCLKDRERWTNNQIS